MKTRLLCSKVRLDRGGYAPDFGDRYFGGNKPGESLYWVSEVAPDYHCSLGFYRAATRAEALKQYKAGV